MKKIIRYCIIIISSMLCINIYTHEHTISIELGTTLYNAKRCTSHFFDIILTLYTAMGLPNAYNFIASKGTNMWAFKNSSIHISAGLGLLTMKKNWDPDKELYQQPRYFLAGLATVIGALILEIFYKPGHQ